MELWDIYDINRNKTGKVIDRHSDVKLQDGEYHLVVACIIMNSKGELLISKRSEKKDYYPLMWEFTGGACKKDENSLQSILREVNEEIGIKFTEADAKLYKTEIVEEKKYFKDVWFFKTDVDASTLRHDDGEVLESKWVSFNEFDKMYQNNEIVPAIKFTKDEYSKLLK